MTPPEEEYTTTTSPQEGGGKPLGEKSPQQIEDEITQIRAEMDTTLNAIERQLSPGELIDRALHSVKGGPAEFATNLGRSIRDNPVPAVLVGIGIGWLFLSESGATKSAGEKTGEWKEKGGELKERARGRLQEASHSVSEKMHQTRDRMQEMREKVAVRRERLHSRTGYRQEIHSNRLPVLLAGVGLGWLMMNSTVAARTGERQSEGWDEKGAQWKEAAGEWKEAGKARFEDTSRSLSERMHRVGEKAQMRRGKLTEKTHMLREKAQQVQGGYRHIREEKPMLLIAFGIALGVLAGGLLPITRKEKEVLGPSGEKAREMIQEKAEKAGQMAGHVAEAAAEAAREETERQMH